MQAEGRNCPLTGFSCADDQDDGVQMGGPELMIVLAVVALLFGPGRVTDVARSLGESIHEFRAAQRADQTDDRSDGPDLG